MTPKSDISDSTLPNCEKTPFVSFSAIGLYSIFRIIRYQSIHRIGSPGIQVSRMTFFIQSCPACARRFQVHMRALGKQVECRYCFSIFRSFDGTEDVGEASDTAAEWARDQWIREQETDSSRQGRRVQESDAQNYHAGDFSNVESENHSYQDGQQEDGSSSYRPR